MRYSLHLLISLQQVNAIPCNIGTCFLGFESRKAVSYLVWPLPLSASKSQIMFMETKRSGNADEKDFIVWYREIIRIKRDKKDKA